MMYKSVATIDSPEFINLQPLELNPLMSSCEIKVCYLGENRNGSFINKETATSMAKTLRGAPIVGYYKTEKEDFADHGDRVIIDDEGIKFQCMTKPYGFVSPDAKVWFQNFEDIDDFGNVETREYLMTTGYLWTGQYPECDSVIKNGKGQSMEFDPETLKGKWAENKNTGMEFFIINDAIFSKLCILGDDVEPCFEGANVTAPNISKTFSKIDNDFKNTLYSMMKDLQKLNFSLQGGQSMEDNNVTTTEEPVIDPIVEPTVETPLTASNDTSTEFKKDEEDKNKDNKDPEEKSADDNKKDDEDEDEDKTKHKCEDEDKDEKKKYSLLEEQYNTLKADYDTLSTEVESLRAFKLKVEDAEKDEMINSFYMLSDEDKADIIANKSNYSLEEIESKLSVICVRKKVNFSLDTNTENHNNKEEKPNVIFNLGNNDSSTPAWIKACENTKNNRK